MRFGSGQYHLAERVGAKLALTIDFGFAPTRYREVVLTASNFQLANSHTSISSCSRGVACDVLIARSTAAIS